MSRHLRPALLRTLLTAFVGVGWNWEAHAQALRINEIVASNTTGLQDEDGDRPDWIELYNSGPVAISPAGYGLSDDRGTPFKWRIPGFIVPSHGRLLVFASGKDRTNSAASLHANFSIRAGGERLFLTSPSGLALDEFPSRALPRDVAFGRLPDGSTNLVYFATATPRSANTGPGYSSVVLPPEFSFGGGFYENPFSISILSPDPIAAVRFTLDGSEPTEASPLYVGPLTVRDRASDPSVLSLIRGTATVNQHTDGWFPPSGRVAKSTVIRARAFRDGALPSETATRTWFIGANSPARFQLPVISIVTDTNGLFDYTKGIYVLGKVFDDYVRTHPAEPLTGHTPANYQGRGPEWDRPGHLEFYLPDGSLAFERDVMLDIQGQSSRSFRQKSLGARALGGDFDYEVFPGLKARGTGLPLRTFAKLRLGNSGNDWAYTMFRDALSHVLVQDLPVDGLAYRPSVVFLDGEFWGIHNLREQQDGAWIAAHYGVARPDVVLCEGQGVLLEGNPGDEASFTSLREYIRTHDLSQPANARYVESQMDVDNFLLYHAIEIYLANADWPHNNIRYWRKRTPDTDLTAPSGHDGRWRWMLFDTDLGYAHPWSGGYGDATLAAATNPAGRPGIDAPWSTVILRQLLKARPFRDRFINTMADRLNSHFREARASAVLDSLNAAITPAMPEHIRRWRTMNDSMTGWSNNVRAMRLFATQRPVNVRQQMLSYFHLDGFANLTVDVQPAGAGQLQVNSLRIDVSTPGANPASPYPWRGSYFKGVPLTLRAQAAPGWRFAGWMGRPELSTNWIELTLAAPTEMVARFERLAVQISSIIRGTGGDLTLDYTGSPSTTYTLQASQDLKTWDDLALATSDGSGSGRIRLLPEASGLWEHRFYRLFGPETRVSTPAE